MRGSHCLLVLVSIAAAFACNRVGGSAEPVAYPSRAYLGETIQIPISGSSPISLPWLHTHDASTENVIIRIEDNVTGLSDDVVPRAILDGELGNASAESTTGVTIAVFDLPQSLSFTIPTSVTLKAIRMPDNVPLYEAGIASHPQLEILGDVASGDGPTDFWPFGTIADAEAPPTLRFQGAAGSFPAGQPIGSVQLELVYPTSSLSVPRAFPLGEAEHAAVSVASIGPDRLRVVLVHPSPTGFQLVAPYGVGDLGAGPFLDVSFDKSAPFDTLDFTVENLMVTAPDGSVLVDLVGDSTSYFALHARRNL